MTPEEFERVASLFEEARTMPVEQRERFLDRACAGSPAMRAELDSLIAHHDDGTGAFEGLLKTPCEKNC